MSDIVQIVTNKMTMDQIQSILRKGGNILFQKGTYKITKTLYLYKDSRIDLGGSSLQQGGKINHIFLTYSDANTTKYNGQSNIEIMNGTLEGMGSYKTKLNLITLCHARDISIHNVTFKDVVEFHSLEINSSYNVMIRNCNFYGHNTTLDDEDFREQIQIDSAVESALVVVPIGSKWYDGTSCDTITISNCNFAKSSGRPAASQCIGNHCQFSGPKHKRITIINNRFTGGNQTTPNAPCIRLVGMEDVVIANNTCSGYGRFVYVCTYNTHTYGLRGKESVKEFDGICSNIHITGNKILKPSGTNAVPGVYVASKTGNHHNIFVDSNDFDFSECSGTKTAVSIKNTKTYITGANVITHPS